MAKKSFYLSAVLPQVFLSCLEPKTNCNFMARGTASVQDRNATQIHLPGNSWYQQGSIKLTLPGRHQAASQQLTGLTNHSQWQKICALPSDSFFYCSHSHNIQVPYHSTLNTVTHNYHLPHFPAYPSPMGGNLMYSRVSCFGRVNTIFFT